MTRTAASVLAALVAIAALPSAAQEDESRTRLDDFAIAPGDGSLRVDQVSPGAEAVQPNQQGRDRSIAGVPMGERPSLRPDQLSGPGETSTPAQLSDGSDPTGPIPTAGSTAADSRPQGATRLVGSDRCDPQLLERDLARCLQILELRAQEFNAPAPPQLSAEESLLAAQRSENDGAMLRSGDTRLRFATVQEPNADLDSNQELASIYLGDPAQPNPTAQEPASAEAPGDLAEILRGFGLEQGALQPPQ